MRRFVALALGLAMLAGPWLGAPSGAGAQPKTQITIGIGAEPLTLMGATVVDWTTNAQIENVYDLLFTRDPKTEKILPWLATGYRVIDDRTWEFMLRQGVRFHDGEPFTADAVKFTLEYILDPKNKTHYLPRFKPVDRVDVVNDHTVRIHTSEPMPVLLSYLSLPGLFILAPEYVRKVGVDYASAHPAGTGPYRFKEWVRGERLVLERNPNYWAGTPKIQTVVFQVIPEFSARLAALLSGQIDVMKDVPPQAVDTVNRSGRAQVRSTVSSRINYLALETLHPGPMQNPKVRQAMIYAVNVDELIKTVLGGQATRICGYVSRFDSGYDPAIRCTGYDPNKAAQMLQEAGYDPKKLALTLDTPSGRYPLDKEVSEAIAAQLGKLGITVHVQVNEWRSHLDKIINRKAGDMFFLGWGPDLEPSGTVGQLFVGSLTYSSFGDPRIEDMIHKAEVTVEPKANAAAFRKVQEALVPLAPWVPLWQQHDLYGVANWIAWRPRPDEKVWMWEAAPK
ncbi:MAG TPA: ABC transporter substrate-binding protein [bacterium]|nr:ABC transporter substrate-binding protein [bacterium]